MPTPEAAEAVEIIKNSIHIPLVADIHFDYRLAIAAAEHGADKIRINPGNIGGEDRVKAVVDCCRAHKVPIRIGVNGGSLEKELLAKYGRVTPEALVESALGHVALLEKYDFTDICISVKSSDVPLNMAAYRLLHERVDYPLHLGVTEAGTPSMGVLKSAIGIGGLLCEGIGDTMRVSLTADPVEEVYAAKRILRACGLRRSGVNLISCPTCGRTAYDMIPLAEELELPVVIHEREAHGDALSIIDEYPSVKGVFHCFSGSPELAQELVPDPDPVEEETAPQEVIFTNQVAAANVE